VTGVSAERIARAVLEGNRQRALVVEGGEVVEIDNLVACFTNLPVSYLNWAMAIGMPGDPTIALRDAQAEFVRRGYDSFGIELEVGRFPKLKAAVRERGHRRIQLEPALALRISELANGPLSSEFAIERVQDAEALQAAAAVDAAVFGSDPETAIRFPGPRILGRDDVTLLIARAGEEVVGQALGWLLEGTVGVFGVAVGEPFRGRGLGSALTIAAVRELADRADVAWLKATPAGKSVYERLGFRVVSWWEVWSGS
jgi:ribosomal protein S18 acetylase RimI-like enzyme